MSSEKITVARNGKTLGEYTTNEISQHLKTGRIIPTDLGWKEGMSTWVPLSNFTEFRNTAKSVRPSIPVTRPATQKIEIHQRSSNGVGIASLVVSIIAIVGCWVPFLGALAMPLAGIAILLGIIGFIIGLTRKSSTGAAIAGIIVAITSIAVFFVVTGTTANAITIAAKRIHNNPSTTPATQSAPAASTIIAAIGSPMTFGDISITLDAITMGKVKLKSDYSDRTSNSANEYLEIAFTITNTSVSRKINYTSWGNGNSFISTAYMSDEFKNKYKHVSFGTNIPANGIKSASLYPGKNQTDSMVFESPIDTAKELHIRLSRANIDAEKDLEFTIPATLISK